jgi:formiminoglutamase
MTINSKEGSFLFEEFESAFLLKFFTHRKGETRIGDFDLNKKNARFVILGIEESIGPLANNGFSGSENAFDSFLRIFLNSQVHEGFNINKISILGSIKFTSFFSSVDHASKQVAELDDFVIELLNERVSENQIPIVIGGGHNNAYPLIKWSSKEKAINVLNLDPHADCREIDHRHSGNSFSYAIDQGILNEYAVLGLHEAFNNSFIRNFLVGQRIKHSYFDDYLIGNRNLIDDASEIIESWNLDKHRIGIEIDMDCIANMPSSAFSPSGWSLDEVRTYLMRTIPQVEQLAYVHLPEAAPKNDLEHKLVGKALTYLVRDIVNHSK